MKIKERLSKLGKRTTILLVVGLVMALGAGALLLEYFGRITTTVDVKRAITLNGEGCSGNVCSENVAAFGGETVTTTQYTATSLTSVDIPIEIATTVNPGYGGIENLEAQYELYAMGTTPGEDKIKVKASDFGITTLSDFYTSSFKQNVIEGYAGHLDIKIDTDNNGIEDDALVFEYAKVDQNDCDDTPYPTGEMDTFGDKGTINDNSYAWLSSGDAGPCSGSPTFYYHSLTDWKTGQTANGKTINGNTAVTALEFKADSRIATSKVKISYLRINDNSISTLTVQAGLDLVLDFIIKFANNAEGLYNIETKVQLQNIEIPNIVTIKD